MGGRVARKRRTPLPIHRRIISALRRIWWLYSPDRAAALQTAEYWDGPRGRKYICAACSAFVGRGDIEVDHTGSLPSPPGVRGSDPHGDWGPYVNGLFGPASTLQVLCKPCHVIKTAQRRAKR